VALAWQRVLDKSSFEKGDSCHITMQACSSWLWDVLMVMRYSSKFLSLNLCRNLPIHLVGGLHVDFVIGCRCRWSSLLLFSGRKACFYRPEFQASLGYVEFLSGVA
jgi:hypothetical protein